MAYFKEIVTKAVIGKGKKTTKIDHKIETDDNINTVLGCWVINHNFNGINSNNKILVNGEYDINVWYSYDNNTKTDIARTDANYCETIKVRELICDNISDHCDVIARVIQQPTCTNACITDEGIEVEIVFELLVEVIGETKMMVTVFACPNDTNDVVDDFENEINEDFIKEQ